MKNYTAIEALESRIAPATFLVNSLADGVPVKDGLLTLREAIVAATTNLPSGDAGRGDFLLDTITFAPALKGGVIELTGSLLIDGGGRLSIIGPGLFDESLTLRGDGAQRVMQITANTAGVALSHLAITGGVAASGGGGGILNNAELALDDVLISGNTANGGGGGIAIIGSQSKLTAHHSRLINNTADFIGGGAIHISGTNTQLALDDTLISGNTSTNGGGIRSNEGTTSSISDSRIVGNIGTASGNGAGIYNRGTMLITATTISGNIGEGNAFYGGGLRNDGDLAITGSTISDNLSQGRGGGIRHTVGTLTIVNTTIAGNTALSSFGGGGLRLDDGTIAIVNSTITGNLDAAASAGNSAGGIAADAAVDSLTIHNTIIAGNLATGGQPADIRGAVTTGNNNLIGIGTAELTGLTNGSNGNRIGTAAAALKAKLGPLQDNGGPVFTMVPLPGSLAIDTGDSFYATAPGAAEFTTDQRGPGFSRFMDGNTNGVVSVDIGAAEYQAAPNANDVTTFSFQTAGGTITATLTGGGTFDLWRNGGDIGQIAIHGATAKTAFALKASTGASVIVQAIHSDAGLKSIALGKGTSLSKSIGIEGALGSVALDDAFTNALVHTGGTAKNVMKITTNEDFRLAVDTTSSVAAINLPKFEFGGSIRAASIGAITAKTFAGASQDDPLDIGDNNSLDLIATVGGIGKLTTTNGTIRDYSIRTSPLGAFGGMSIVSKGTNNVTAFDETGITAGQIGKITIALTSAADGGNSSFTAMEKGSLTATNGNIAGISIAMKHLNTGSKSASGIGQFGINAAAGIGPISILAPKVPGGSGLSSLSIVAGTALLGWENLPTAAAQLAALQTFGLASIKTNGDIGAVTISAAGNIGPILAAEIDNATILAGARLGSDGNVGGTGLAADIFLRPASIASITTGVLNDSVISAGIAAMNGILGDSDDIAGIAGLTTTSSKIGPIKIGTAIPTIALGAAVNHTKTIQAATIAQIIIAGTTLTPTAAGMVLDTGDNVGMDDANDTIIRLR